MSFISILSDTPQHQLQPHGEYNSITLMEYIYNKRITHEKFTARKYCYIIKCFDLKTVFENAGVLLTQSKGRVMTSYWNRRPIEKSIEYGVEICQDDNKDPCYIIYDNQWVSGKLHNIESQHSIFSGHITENEAIKLDGELRKFDVGN
jgi:hypothetical protein